MANKKKRKKFHKKDESQFTEIRSIDSAFANQFMDTIENLARQSDGNCAIVTFNSFNRDWTQAIDVAVKEDGNIEWGYQPFYRSIVSAKLANSDSYPLAVVVRTFTGDRHEIVTENGKTITIPGKQVRMFSLARYGECYQLSPEECFACANVDAQTGEVLPMEATVEYVGPEFTEMN